MVLRLRQHKSANLSFVSGSPLQPHLRVTCSSDHEPLNFKDANRFLCWQSAMRSEIAALHANNIWSFVSFDPSMDVVGYRWVYKIKHRADGAIDRYKARLVARGFTQQEGIDYLETFSPVVKPTTVRLVLSLAVSTNWQIHQLDVYNAFLNGSLQEVVYMQPIGFVDPALPTHVCHLHKSLYGLKQASQAWYTRLSDFLLSIGFRASKVDTSLFILIVNHDIFYLLVYVDDILLTGKNSTLIHHLISLLSSEFKLCYLGNARYFLLIEVIPTSMGLLLS
jgi:histone deacetylase 1/2